MLRIAYLGCPGAVLRAQNLTFCYILEILGVRKRRATRFGVGLSKFQYEISVLDLFGEQNDEAIIMHIWIMMHHDAS